MANNSYTLDDKTADDMTSFLTEFAQIQRAVGNHEKAERAEVVRNTVYSQNAAFVSPL